MHWDWERGAKTAYCDARALTHGSTTIKRTAWNNPSQMLHDPRLARESRDPLSSNEASALCQYSLPTPGHHSNGCGASGDEKKAWKDTSSCSGISGETKWGSTSPDWDSCWGVGCLGVAGSGVAGTLQYGTSASGRSISTLKAAHVLSVFTSVAVSSLATGAVLVVEIGGGALQAVDGTVAALLLRLDAVDLGACNRWVSKLRKLVQKSGASGSSSSCLPTALSVRSSLLHSSGRR